MILFVFFRYPATRVDVIDLSSPRLFLSSRCWVVTTRYLFVVIVRSTTPLLSTCAHIISKLPRSLYEMTPIPPETQRSNIYIANRFLRVQLCAIHRPRFILTFSILLRYKRICDVIERLVSSRMTESIYYACWVRRAVRFGHMFGGWAT